MQQPGLSRAIPGGILGFLAGALIVIIIRGLQSLDPLWATGPGLVMGAFMSAFGFLWGIGAFNPKLSAHGEEAEAPAEEDIVEPRSFLSNAIWQLATLLLIVGVGIAFFAVIPGSPSLTITDDPTGSTKMVGFHEVQLPFGGPTVLVSDLVVLLAFVIFTFISLAAAAAIIAGAFIYLNRGVKEVQMAPAGGAPALTAGEGFAAAPEARPELPDLTARMIVPPYPKKGGLIAWLIWLIRIPINVLIAFLAPVKRTPAEWIKSLVIYAVLFAVLYLFFYYVAIGLIFPDSPLLVPLSIVNAVLIGFLIMRPKYVLQLNGLIALLLARFLRWLPKILQ